MEDQLIREEEQSGAGSSYDRGDDESEEGEDLFAALDGMWEVNPSASLHVTDLHETQERLVSIGTASGTEERDVTSDSGISAGSAGYSCLTDWLSQLESLKVEIQRLETVERNYSIDQLVKAIPDPECRSFPLTIHDFTGRRTSSRRHDNREHSYAAAVPTPADFVSSSNPSPQLCFPNLVIGGRLPRLSVLPRLTNMMSGKVIVNPVIKTHLSTRPDIGSVS